MQQIVHNPVDGIYAATPDYIHALEVRQPERFLHIAGTMGLRPDGSAPKTLDEQLELIWNNIRSILAEAHMTTDNIVRLTSYLRDPSYAAANGAASPSGIRPFAPRELREFYTAKGWFSPERAVRELGWAPRHAIREGFKAATGVASTA